jgi:hypothetical protein
LTATLGAIVGAPVERVVVHSLPGDASTRRYFRLGWSGGKNPNSLIVMQLDQPEPEREIDFILVQRFLSALDLPVPRLFHYDAQRGLLFLEDCGDFTLEEHLRGPGNGNLRHCYRQAVELLAHLQTRTTATLGPECPAYHLRFDVAKLMWEMDFMLEHFIHGLRQLSPTPNQEEALRRHLTQLCTTLADEPTVFTHRDYHSRNLMVHGDRLVMLDFQDARRGPAQYDLASLLRDSYVALDDDFVTEMIEYFMQLKAREENAPPERQHFLTMFDFMSVQRNLKAIGTFAYQKVARGNSRYLQYIPRTLDYVAKTLARQPALQPLRDSLAQLLPELGGISRP